MINLATNPLASGTEILDRVRSPPTNALAHKINLFDRYNRTGKFMKKENICTARPITLSSGDIPNRIASTKRFGSSTHHRRQRHLQQSVDRPRFQQSVEDPPSSNRVWIRDFYASVRKCFPGSPIYTRPMQHDHRQIHDTPMQHQSSGYHGSASLTDRRTDQRSLFVAPLADRRAGSAGPSVGPPSATTQIESSRANEPGENMIAQHSKPYNLADAATELHTPKPEVVGQSYYSAAGPFWRSRESNPETVRWKSQGHDLLYNNPSADPKKFPRTFVWHSSTLTFA